MQMLKTLIGVVDIIVIKTIVEKKKFGGAVEKEEKINQVAKYQSMNKRLKTKMNYMASKLTPKKNKINILDAYAAKNQVIQSRIVHKTQI